VLVKESSLVVLSVLSVLLLELVLVKAGRCLGLRFWAEAAKYEAGLNDRLAIWDWTSNHEL
jgi:hypothetical protein